MAAIDGVMESLRALARPDQLEGMARFGIVGEGRLGISIPNLRRLSRGLGKNHALALQLWDTGIPDARILASMVDDPGELTARQMDRWVTGFESWDVCDQVCMNLFDRSPVAWKKVVEWAKRDEEFVKRAAFSLIACLAWHDREAPDDRFLALLPVIRTASTDERNYVRKAVNWALRHIGKRNARLNRAAIAEARIIQTIDSRSARWIATDALRELRDPTVRARLKRRGRP
jgi:3-methyladenine DNA glycosylase AlkD